MLFAWKCSQAPATITYADPDGEYGWEDCAVEAIGTDWDQHPGELVLNFRHGAPEGGLFATPILNMPEVGILGVHQMKQKPVVRDGQIVVGNVMLLSLSFRIHGLDFRS